MFSHIVVPLDGSRESNIAVPHACLMARVSGATVTLLRVVSSGREVPKGQEFLDSVAREYAASDVTINVVARDGHPATIILDEVRQRGADLVVMRTHGRFGLSRAVLGSVAERIVEHSPTPVLLVPPHESTNLPSALDAILVPVDGSPGGALALGIARELARRTGATLQLLQVAQSVQPYQNSALLVNGPMYVDSSWDEDTEAAARASVEALASRLTAQGLVVRAEAFVASSVPDAINTNAAERACGLIIMSSHAHTGAARALLGSVTDAVVRAARCPVLVVRRDTEAGPVPQEETSTVLPE